MKRNAKWRRWIFWLLAAAGVVAITIVGWRPVPVKIETALAKRGPLQVTVDEDGEARAHDRYVVTAPVEGSLARVELHDGDRVTRGQVIALLNPLPLDPRQKEESAAHLHSAEALKREADERVERAQADYEQQRRDRERAERLFATGDISAQTFELRKSAETASLKDVEAARFKAQAAAYEVDATRAALLAVDAQRAEADRVVPVHSPVAGRVLRVVEKSERVVGAGAPLLILGDNSRLEVVIDVLSADAVKIKAGAPVLLEGWGGPQPVRARVRVIEPYAFTKVSALGVEEQRVNVVADFVDRPGPLGDGYRVEARIVVWEKDDVLKVPVSALFRNGQSWCVFVLEGGRARRREVQTGQRATDEVELLQGLQEGAEVILHPSNLLNDGVRVAAR